MTSGSKRIHLSLSQAWQMAPQRSNNLGKTGLILGGIHNVVNLVQRWADGPMGGWADGRMGGWARCFPK